MEATALSGARLEITKRSQLGRAFLPTQLIHKSENAKERSYHRTSPPVIFRLLEITRKIRLSTTDIAPPTAVSPTDNLPFCAARPHGTSD
jgi:hypothetical protein